MSTDLKSYGFDNETAVGSVVSGALADAQQAKAVQEIQAALIIAQRFPRNQAQAFQDIMKACERPVLAESAQYAYPKGGKVVSGPSIRLAEVLAQNWGNITFGFRQLTSANGMSEVEAFAWDLQKNVQVTKIFQVSHKRDTKKGSYILTDEREISELVANQAQRRVRSCILGVIPGDVTDAAVKQCEKTQANDKEPFADRLRKVVSAFDEQGVTVEMLEKRLGHKLDATIEQELVTLRGIYKSLKDGMADRSQFFDMGAATVATTATVEAIDKETGEVLPVTPVTATANPMTSGLVDKLSKDKK